jgi:nucleotide-binding universal stress UspA family protein
LADSAKERLDEFVEEHLQELGQSTVAKVLTGRPADEIVAYSRDAEAAIIVMTTHGYSGVKQVLLGSTTEEVLRHADCPVMAVRTVA